MLYLYNTFISDSIGSRGLLKLIKECRRRLIGQNNIRHDDGLYYKIIIDGQT